MTGSFRKLVFPLLPLVLAAAACSPDPYGIHPEALKVEKGVTGITSLDVNDEYADRGEYIIMEGVPFPQGGIIYEPFYLEEVPITPTLGNAILARKARWAEVFGLLSKGAVGEGYEGLLVPRVSPVELTLGEQRIIELENADREVISKHVIAALRVPEWEAIAINEVFAYARYQVYPDGIWIEKGPGNWIVKGGREYQERMMRRDPIPVRTEERIGYGDGAPGADYYAQPVTVEPVIIKPVRETKEEPFLPQIDDPAPPQVLIEDPAPTIR